MKPDASSSLNYTWTVRSVAIVAAIFIVSAIAGFMILPLMQPNANVAGLWDAICSAAGGGAGADKRGADRTVLQSLLSRHDGRQVAQRRR